MVLGHLSSDFFLFFLYSIYSFSSSREVSGEGLCNWEQLENHSGPHISLLLVLQQVLEEVVVGLGFLEEWELPSPSNPLLQACKKDIGNIQILSRLGFQRSSRHRRNILPLSEPEQLLEEKEVVGLDFLGLALLDDSLVVELALDIRNGFP